MIASIVSNLHEDLDAFNLSNYFACDPLSMNAFARYAKHRRHSINKRQEVLKPVQEVHCWSICGAYAVLSTATLTTRLILHAGGFVL